MGEVWIEIEKDLGKSKVVDVTIMSGRTYRQHSRIVLAAFKSMVATLHCGSCNSWAYVSPIKGELETIPCECGSANFNLRPKQ
jgi:lipopolysaccharide biosynthesis regulator YciM